jgi:MoaA/NifB/PqqE/SkfB family radical SAM enzyme
MYSINLVVELSRRCNIECGHCLRGEQRKDTIDFSKLEVFIAKLVKDNHDLEFLSIGGGEPGFAVADLWKLLSLLKEYKVRLRGVSLATNGLVNIDELLLWFKEAYAYSLVKHTSAFYFSDDKFHREAIIKKYHSISAFRQSIRKAKDFFTKEGIDVGVIVEKQEFSNQADIIKMGNALDFGSWEVLPTPFIEFSSLMYFTYDGLIFSSCDLSYLEMDKAENSEFYMGEYSDSIGDIITNYNNNF